MARVPRRGLRLPHDISLVGFDDVGWMAMVDPGITVVAQPAFEMGRRAARLFLRRAADSRAAVDRDARADARRARIDGAAGEAPNPLDPANQSACFASLGVWLRSHTRTDFGESSLSPWRAHMVTRWRRTALLVVGVVSCVVLAATSASAKVSESAGVATAQAGQTLTIYGMGGRDDVAQGRLDLANRVIERGGDSVSNPVNAFNDQAFLARLAARDIPDLVYMSWDKVGTYAARNVLVPLANCLASEKIDKKMYRKAALDSVTYKGQLYALPEFTNQITLIVNNDAARKAGVNVSPTSRRRTGSGSDRRTRNC